MNRNQLGYLYSAESAKHKDDSPCDNPSTDLLLATVQYNNADTIFGLVEVLSEGCSIAEYGHLSNLAEDCFKHRNTQYFDVPAVKLAKFIVEIMNGAALKTLQNIHDEVQVDIAEAKRDEINDYREMIS